MDRQGPLNQPHYYLTRGLNRIRQQKRCDDDSMFGQEGSMMHHLANVHSVTGPAIIIYRMAFSVIWQDRSRQPVKTIVHWIGN